MKSNNFQPRNNKLSQVQRVGEVVLPRPDQHLACKEEAKKSGGGLPGKFKAPTLSP